MPIRSESRRERGQRVLLASSRAWIVFHSPMARNANTATPGDIVVALVDEEEATLKRFRRKGASIALEAANPAYETRIFGPDRIKVQGRLVGLIRKY